MPRRPAELADVDDDDDDDDEGIHRVTMSMTTTAPTRMFARNASARALGRGARKRYERVKR